jgi:hypothetical protein
MTCLDRSARELRPRAQSRCCMADERPAGPIERDGPCRFSWCETNSHVLCYIGGALEYRKDVDRGPELKSRHQRSD